MATAQPLSQLLGRPIFGGGANPTTASLPAGYIVEHGAQQIQPLAAAHQAMVDNATEHAAANPLIVVHLPANGFTNGQ